MPDTHAVVLAEPGLETVEEQENAAAALAATLGMLRYDGLRAARDGRGILAENLAPDRARALAEDLAARGIEAACADAARLGPPDTVVRVREVDAGGETLRVLIGYGAMEALAWETLDLVGVCLFFDRLEAHARARRESLRKSFNSRMRAARAGNFVRGVGALRVSDLVKATGMHDGSARKLDPNQAYVADLHCVEPPRILRIRSDQCVYPYLRERLRPHAEENFRLALGDIAANAPRALLSPPTMRFLEGDPLIDSGTDRIEFFERYNRWLYLATLAFGEGGEAKEESAPPPRRRLDDFRF